MNELVLYSTEHGLSQIKLRGPGHAWLTQLQLAELFQTTKQNVAKHLKAIFAVQELRQACDVQDAAELKALENTLKKRPKP